MGMEVVRDRGDAPDAVLLEKRNNRELAMLKKLEGAIAKKKVKKSSATGIAEQGIRRQKIQPLIIHAVNPPLIHAEPSTFMRTVQSLTGCRATRLRCEEEELSMRDLGLLVSSPTSTVGSPCSSSSTTTTSTTLMTTSAVRPVVLDERAGEEDGIIAGWGCKGRIISAEEDQYDQEECINQVMGDGPEISRSESSVAVGAGEYHDAAGSPSSNGSLLNMQEDEHNYPIIFNCSTGERASATSHDAEEDLFMLADSFTLLPHDADDDLGSTLDSYLEHLLSSYDRNASRTLTCTSAFLADVCDPLLLIKE